MGQRSYFVKGKLRTYVEDWGKIGDMEKFRHQNRTIDLPPMNEADLEREELMKEGNRKFLNQLTEDYEQ